MILEKTFIKDLILLKPQVYTDERGYFMESFNQKKIEKVIKDTFVPVSYTHLTLPTIVREC